MILLAKGWSRHVRTRTLAQYDLSDHTTERHSTEYNRPNITHEVDFTTLRFRVSIPRDSSMGGDYVFVLYFTPSDLAALLWSMLKRNGVADILGGLIGKIRPTSPGATE